MPVSIDLERCDGNAACMGACAFAAIEVRDGKAVVFDNCTDCAACVLACPTNAIWSDLFSKPAKAGIMGIEFSTTSGIAGVVERTARAADVAAVWMIAPQGDSAVVAGAIARAFTDGGYSLVVLPHRGAGPAIAARVAALTNANLVCGCSDLQVDETGGVRAMRPRFGGIVTAQAKCAPGLTVATIFPRSNATIVVSQVDVSTTFEKTDLEKPTPPVSLARRIVVLGPGISEGTHDAVIGVAHALGAIVVSPDGLGTKPLAPDLAFTFGVTGSTEINSALRNSRVLVAVVDDPNATIALVADYLLVGDVEAHAKALLAAL